MEFDQSYIQCMSFGVLGSAYPGLSYPGFPLPLLVVLSVRGQTTGADNSADNSADNRAGHVGHTSRPRPPRSSHLCSRHSASIGTSLLLAQQQGRKSKRCHLPGHRLPICSIATQARHWSHWSSRTGRGARQTSPFARLAPTKSSGKPGGAKRNLNNDRQRLQARASGRHHEAAFQG